MSHICDTAQIGNQHRNLHVPQEKNIVAHARYYAACPCTCRIKSGW